MRWALLLGGVAASVLVTAALWAAGFPGFFLFLFLPFLALWPRRQEAVRACATCGWSTRDPAARYCPRDATRLSSP